jgi:hypothetical protein
VEIPTPGSAGFFQQPGVPPRFDFPLPKSAVAGMVRPCATPNASNNAFKKPDPACVWGWILGRVMEARSLHGIF